MDAQKLRAMAVRCRELEKVAVREEIREQLHQWAEDFEAEAEAIEKIAATRDDKGIDGKSLK